MSDSYPLNQMKLVSDIMSVISEQQPNIPVKPRLYNTVIKAAAMICEEFAKPIVNATAGMGLAAWLESDDVGSSSKYMASVLSRYASLSGLCHFRAEFAYPQDCDDFGRCVRLVRAVPQFETHIHCLIGHTQQWDAIARKWDKLVELYDSGSFDELYGLIHQVYESAD